MPFNIEILSVGGDFDGLIAEAAQILNGAQKEFQFLPPPERLRGFGRPFVQSKYHRDEVLAHLQKFREEAKGDRRYLLAVIDRQLSSDALDNCFGSHRAEKGLAVVTLFDHKKYLESTQLYLCYYFIRYALSFVCPTLKNHEETRGCFFDKKLYKPDIKKSVESGSFCEECRENLWRAFNEEINTAIQKMIAMMKAIRADSEESLEASSLRGQVDIGIITIREDEFEAMLDRFASRRHVKGNGSDYNYSRVIAKGGEELRVVVARSPEQGQGPAQALASNMIADLEPDWIFVVGIAGGFPAPEYTLGDVLLSQRMHDFSVSAAIEGKKPEFQDMGGPMTVEVEKIVTNLRAVKSKLGPWSSKEFLGRQKPHEAVPDSTENEAFYGGLDWRKKVISSLKKHFVTNGQPRDPDFFAATLITSGTLLKDTELATLWRTTARQTAGVEMELGGVCRAARYGADGRTRVLAVRGLSDIVGYKRAPEWTEYACRSAAAFADALIRSGIIRRKQ